MPVNPSREGDGVGQAPVFDAWTSIGFKQALGNKRTAGQSSWLAPTWVGEHARRLQAYIILQSYIDNAARFFLTESVAAKRDEHREYGDASLIGDTIRAALLGHDQTISVDGAEDFVEDLAADATPEQKKKAEAARPARELQDWFEKWADLERFGQKTIETERNAVNLGDGVYVLGWDGRKKRTRLRVYDPGFYFPVLDDGNEDDYPTRVHIAWEMLPDKAASRRRIRRITWELRNLPEGQVRTYAWGDEPTDLACYMTDAVWTLDSGAPEDIDNLSGAKADYLVNGDGDEIKDLDLQIDFIPVVHLPNTVALMNHFGKSSLATVLQVLDDLANADTDMQKAAGVAGSPPIGLAGATLGGSTLTYKPGQVWQLGENGKLSTLDVSAALAALVSYVEFLLKRLSVNSRVPEALLGRVSPSDVPSGLALRLGFGPLETMVGEMRLVRDEKYGLVFKFTHRLAQAGGQAEVPAEYIQTQLVYGSFIPEDLGAVVELVTKLLVAGAISLETSLAMLKEAGIDIEDVISEARRIDSRNFEEANKLLDALGNEGEVAKFLGREGVEPDVPPAAAPATGSSLPAPPGAPPAPAPVLPPPRA